MGRPKALLRLSGGETFLERLASTFHAAGVDEVVAVIGINAAAIRVALARAPGLCLVENPDPSRGQLSSLLVGLDAVLASAWPAPRGVFVSPVDLPLVTTDTVRRVFAAWESTGAPIARPANAGQHGHPVIFAASTFGELRAADPAIGARMVTSAHAAEIVDVDVEDRGAFEDIDTPEDYARLVHSRSTGL